MLSIEWIMNRCKDSFLIRTQREPIFRFTFNLIDRIESESIRFRLESILLFRLIAANRFFYWINFQFSKHRIAQTYSQCKHLKTIVNFQPQIRHGSHPSIVQPTSQQKNNSPGFAIDFPLRKVRVRLPAKWVINIWLNCKLFDLWLCSVCGIP